VPAVCTKNMKFILAKKENMTQIFDNEGRVTPVTVLSAGPVVVTQVKDEAKDGYKAIQVGYGTRRASRVTKAMKGHLKDAGPFAHLREFEVGEGQSYSVGDVIDVSAFAPGDTVMVSGVSKGKGFQGVVKLHNFGGGRRTHGQKHSEREPGSIGGGLRTRVPKGMRMAGRMGGDRITVKNLKVVHVDTDGKLLYVSGAVPGKRGTLIEVRA
jgi:large subunit ribosomal protein L3